MPRQPRGRSVSPEKQQRLNALLRKPIPDGSRRGTPVVLSGRPMPPDFGLAMSYRPLPNFEEEAPVREGYVEPAFASSIATGLATWTWR